MSERFFERTMTPSMRTKRIGILWAMSEMCVIIAFLCFIPEVGQESPAVSVGVLLLLLGLGGMHVKIAQNASDIDTLSKAMEGGKAVSEATQAMLAGPTKQVS